MPWVKMTNDMFFGFNYNPHTKEFQVYGVTDKEPEVVAIRPSNPNLFPVEIEEHFKKGLHEMLEVDWGTLAKKEISNINTIEDISKLLLKIYPPLFMSQLYDSVLETYGEVPFIKEYVFDVNP